MDDASLVVPFVLPAENDRVAGLEILEPWCQIDVVTDQHCVSRRQPDQEALVPRTSEVIGEDLGDDTLRLDNDSRALRSVQLLDFSLCSSPFRIGLKGGPDADPSKGQPAQSQTALAPT